MQELELVKISEFARKYPRALSGGQRQRIGIARALAVDPQVLLLDEPFSALDAKTTHELHEDLLHIWRTTGTTIVMVSHLIEEAVSLADRVMLMRAGTIVHEYPIALPRPRREQAGAFERQVGVIRKEFFR
jgi:NitT/TauT family transport system ATP-binding protein